VAKIDFAWELGAGTGHFTTLLPIATVMQARGHEVRFLLREVGAGADLEGAAEIPREGAPVWSGPILNPKPLNFGEILLNFGYFDPVPVKQLLEAWRAQLSNTDAVVANVAPAGHLAALTLGIPSFEISQGFHNPPASLPAPPLQDWEPVSRARLEAADRRVLNAVNPALADFGVKPLGSIGELFAGRSMLLTYPELDIYPERGPSDYYGITDTGEGKAVPAWPAGTGPRVFAYLYHYYKGLEPLLASLAGLKWPALVFCRGIAPTLKGKYGGGTLQFSDEPMSVSKLLPQSDIVVCHGSHQMTAQALLAGKPVLLAPTQLEQFLIMRRVTRQGAGLGIAPEVPNADFASALRALSGNPAHAAKAREFARRYAAHDREAMLATVVARIEAALGKPIAR
jgi:UDP:flavonoid glycosyltransferase YjiC (YdhE family)